MLTGLTTAVLRVSRKLFPALLFVLVTAMVLWPLLTMSGCAPATTDSTPSQATEQATPTPAAQSENDWTVSAPKVNPMDGVKQQFVSTGHLVGLVLCFENGIPCHVPVYVGVADSVHCWIEGDEVASYHRRIRIKFDDGKPRSEIWSITDDHKGLIPPRPQAFIAELKKHRTLMVEFGCDRSDPGDVITLGIRGLQEALDSAGLKSGGSENPSVKKGG